MPRHHVKMISTHDGISTNQRKLNSVNFTLHVSVIKMKMASPNGFGGVQKFQNLKSGLKKKRNLNVFSFFQFKKTNAVGWGCFGGLGCLALSVQRVHKTLSSLSTSHCALWFISVSVHCAGPYVSKAWLTALLHGLPVQVYICIFEDNGSQLFVTALYCTRFYDVFLCHP